MHCDVIVIVTEHEDLYVIVRPSIGRKKKPDGWQKAVICQSDLFKWRHDSLVEIGS